MKPERVLRWHVGSHHYAQNLETERTYPWNSQLILVRDSPKHPPEGQSRALLILCIWRESISALRTPLSPQLDCQAHRRVLDFCNFGTSLTSRFLFVSSASQASRVISFSFGLGLFADIDEVIVAVELQLSHVHCFVCRSHRVLNTSPALFPASASLHFRHLDVHQYFPASRGAHDILQLKRTNLTMRLALLRRHHSSQTRTHSGFGDFETRHAQSALYEDRCFDGPKSLPDVQRVQSIRQSSQLSFGSHWKLRSDLRQ